MRRALAGLAALAFLLAPSGVVRAATAPTFGPTTLTARFLTSVTMTEPVTLPSDVRAVEARILTGDSSVVEVHPLARFGTGATTLTFTLDTPSGSLMPNTPVRARFRVTLADGSTVDGPEGTIRYLDDRLAWKTLAGPVVRVHWTVGDDAFGKRALSIAEKAIADTSALLGVTETDPIDFYVYADQQQFYDVLGPGSRENVGGVAFPSIRTLLANIAPSQIGDSWVSTVIPHELTHLVFQTAVDNPYHEPPRWLNEGLAVYLSQGNDASDQKQVRDAVSAETLMPLTALESQFPTTYERFSLAYAESVSAVDHLVARYGRDALVALVRSYAGGVTDDEAFSAALKVDVAGFQADWYRSLGASAPVALGPQAALDGPLPSGWGAPAAVATPGPTARPVTAPTGDGSPSPVAAVALGLAIGGILGAVILLFRSRRRPAAPPDPEP